MMLMSHVSLAEVRDLEDSTELTSEPDNESIPPKGQKPGLLTKLLGDIYTLEQHCEKNAIDHVIIAFTFYALHWITLYLLEIMQLLS